MATTETNPTTFVCAWCDRVYVGGAWRAAADAGLPASPDPAHTTHGICEECAGEMVPVTPRAARRFCRPGG
jgi:hypothetical protein